ncbi:MULTISPECIES: CapA family protein [Mesorhizobium]|uniref:CapA family protein n=1 Tax=Mesorhizobium TaxID=68287 RepID=UPI0007EC87CE|nr:MULTISPECIES: CapA family protein [Mesorhizobium]TPJ40431.1 CapA family protein [Mesorhizobium sp. B2-6-6]ARP67189.1 capsule biosynthesis protein CapA [Mesorhizobium sp. WSM1497]MCA0002769.1 CapA family protein [Mesorhizobium sp. B264B2A]MCA0009080.1 CapA family protein [Mesorhizobium sp. B264B1B]MCA0014523.1 CapA family protein [Mesorhizobium sp. B294B1A1]
MPSPFTLALTGQSLIYHDIRHVSDDGFATIKELIRQADASFTNLETTILGRHGGWPMKGTYFQCSPPVVLDNLKDIGFSALALSNNHAFDLGPAGVLSTLEEVDEREFLRAGIGVDASDASKAGIKQLGKRKVALIAMDAGPGPATMYADNAAGTRPARPGVNKLDVSRVFEVDDEKFANLRSIQETFLSNSMERGTYTQPDDPRELTSSDEIDFYGTIFRRSSENCRRIIFNEQSLRGQLAAIRKASLAGAFVIAYLHHHHWEPDWREVPEWVQFFARSCIDAGANAFASHGAPVLQPIEIYRGAPIFYGLGNFLFHLPEGEDEWSSPDIWKSIVATCSFDGNNHLESIDLAPIVIGGEQRLSSNRYHERLVPVPASKELAGSMLEDLSRRSQKYGTEIVLEDARVLLPKANSRSVEVAANR